MQELFVFILSKDSDDKHSTNGDFRLILENYLLYKRSIITLGNYKQWLTSTVDIITPNQEIQKVLAQFATPLEEFNELNYYTVLSHITFVFEC